MDKSKQNKDWSWLPNHMPQVAALMREKRLEVGDAVVNTAWRRGVVLQEPDWFFAQEGALCVGVAGDAIKALRVQVFELGALLQGAAFLYVRCDAGGVA